MNGKQCFFEHFPILTPNSSTTFEKTNSGLLLIFFPYQSGVYHSGVRNERQEDISPETTQNQQKNILKEASAMTISVSSPDLNKAVDDIWQSCSTYIKNSHI